MKYRLYLFFAFLLVLPCALHSSTPEIPISKAFDGRYNGTPGVKINEIRQAGNYYYSIEVTQRPQIIKDLLVWIKETDKIAETVNKEISSTEQKISIICPGGVIVLVRYRPPNSWIKISIQSNESLAEATLNFQPGDDI